MNYKNLHIGQRVYHSNVYNGRELMEIVGIRKNQVELKGDYSGGTNNVCQSDWETIEGVITYEQHIAKEIMEFVDIGTLKTDDIMDLLSRYRIIIELEK